MRMSWDGNGMEVLKAHKQSTITQKAFGKGRDFAHTPQRFDDLFVVTVSVSDEAYHRLAASGQTSAI